MGLTLHCDCDIETEKGPIYWWPLLFELLHSYNFCFNSPYHTDVPIHYTYCRASDDVESVSGSFVIYGMKFVTMILSVLPLYSGMLPAK